MKSIQQLLEELTLDEKIALVSGHNFMYTNPIPRLNIPSIRMSDGPHGLRIQDGNGDNGVTSSLPATCFPAASTSVNSWNTSLLEKMGNALALEASFYGVDIILGPAINIKRNPLCGRNFEYFSEDPFLTGKMGASIVKGIQEKGVGVSVKHFALNNEERYRFMGNSICNERAMREIYLKQFENIVKETKPESIMSAYNQINGTHCSENEHLLKDILRSEWNFDGVVMTDWGGTKDRVLSVKAGNDLEMPGDSTICRKWLHDAVENGNLDIKDLDECVKRILNLIQKHKIKNTVSQIDWDKHNELSKEIALESAVLLKNDNILPLNENSSILVIGELFEKMRYQGSGSSMINPAIHVTTKDAFLNHKINFKYVKGYKENATDVDRTLIDEAIEAYKDYDKAIVFLGLTDYVETEGDDRDSMLLPDNQIELMNELIKENKEIIVVFYGGSPVELPFYKNIKGMINMYLPGQSGGEAAYELLFGKVNPSGKLGETWPMTYEDVPFGSEFNKAKQEIYKESIYVGYRYYLTANKETRFPFGYGLSYTSFDYSNMFVEQDKNKIIVKLDVKNTGKIKGKEIVQIYIKSPNDNIHRPERELKGFAKVDLGPNETKNVTIEINKDDLKYWDVEQNRFVLEKGIYTVLACKNSEDIVLSQSIDIDGESIKKADYEIYRTLDFDKLTDEKYEEIWNIKIPDMSIIKPYTMESMLMDLNYSFMGKILYKAILSVAKKQMKQAKKLPDSIEKENKIKGAIFMKRILKYNSLRSLSMSSSGALPYNFAEGFRDLSNGHMFKGINDFTRKIKVPTLPVDNKEE